jgi:hypothetical protein
MAVLARHWVPNHNNGRLVVDVEGDKYGDGVYRCVSPFFIFGILALTPLWLQLRCSIIASVLSDEGAPPYAPVCSTAHVIASRMFFDVAAWFADI